jgi:hypothetical protein
MKGISMAETNAVVEVDVKDLIRIREDLVGVHNILNGGPRQTALDRIESLVESVNKLIPRRIPQKLRDAIVYAETPEQRQTAITAALAAKNA